MPLRRAKFSRQAVAEFARATRDRFSYLSLRISVTDKLVLISGRRLDPFTQRELTLIAQQYFPTHQIRFRLTTPEPTPPKR